MPFDPTLTTEQFCYLTTTGRVTGNPHEIEIWFGFAHGRLYMLAGARDRSDWVRNLIRQPNVIIRIAGQTFDAVARVVEADTPENEMARKLLVEKYRSPRDDLSGWGRTALPVAFELKS
jgi:deazaflavin-dependent oxidoreductase (nitroreductase family)